MWAKTRLTVLFNVDRIHKWWHVSQSLRDECFLLFKHETLKTNGGCALAGCHGVWVRDGLYLYARESTRSKVNRSPLVWSAFGLWIELPEEAGSGGGFRRRGQEVELGGGVRSWGVRRRWPLRTREGSFSVCVGAVDGTHSGHSTQSLQLMLNIVCI